MRNSPSPSPLKEYFTVYSSSFVFRDDLSVLFSTFFFFLFGGQGCPLRIKVCTFVKFRSYSVKIWKLKLGCLRFFGLYVVPDNGPVLLLY